MNLSTAGGFYRVESIICCALQTATDPKEPDAVKTVERLCSSIAVIPHGVAKPGFN